MHKFKLCHWHLENIHVPGLAPENILRAVPFKGVWGGGEWKVFLNGGEGAEF